ncbi:N-acetylmuramoyl-L-alanine amidase [Paracoccus sp. (in: a-proteobacteria)]|uniref:N-acetylmuramoyl-L-alanine amidase n=1 Tax=Paracoccus sp. TaxID=267 RepID=UPI0026DEFFC9|nr:N-acetylmuramoyl-L-alanine amidase [Paracoccus sp. (in: a-proteobacteria)]MDO5648846.1 N-acetylmuramoyl-L-alanine amidase [Paracoccus sp. (in: a-proteobacteria)]
MRVEHHKITTIPFRAAHHTGGIITPSLVVLHDTAGRLDHGNTADYLRGDNPQKVSCHFVIERDGSIEQQVPTNRRANHAGLSSYHGRAGCNTFSIGIELVNPGRMSRRPDDGYGPRGRAWWGQVFSGSDYELAAMTTPEHGEGVWMAYSPDQIAATVKLLTVLFHGIPTLTDIRPHWYVSPGRKVDTNPLFPLEEVRTAVLGLDDPADLAVMAASDDLPTATMIRVATNGAGLNMRRWPYSPQVLASVPHGTLLAPIREGVFDGRRHHLVQFDNREGWIISAYTQPA